MSEENLILMKRMADNVDSFDSADLYQLSLSAVDKYPNLSGPLVFGLAEEVGEVAGIFKRIARSDMEYADKLFVRDRLKDELGDVIWYVARLAARHNIRLSEILRRNLEKLHDRAERNVIHGEGDGR